MVNDGYLIIHSVSYPSWYVVDDGSLMAESGIMMANQWLKRDPVISEWPQLLATVNHQLKKASNTGAEIQDGSH